MNQRFLQPLLIILTCIMLNTAHTLHSKNIKTKTPSTVQQNTEHNKDTTSSCAKATADRTDSFSERKTIGKMSYEELKKTKNKHINSKHNVIAIKYLEKMVPLCDDLNELKDIMLELADLLFDTGDLIKAEKMYTEFTKLYPGSDKVEYASYKAILCCFYDTLDAERDQSKTEETVQLTKKFLERSDIFTTYTKDVQDINKKCHQKLFESEVNIVNFHIKREHYTAAEKCLALIRNNFSGDNFEPEIISLECKLAEKQGNTQLSQKKQAELTEKFPIFSAQLVAKNKKSRGFINRF